MQNKASMSLTKKLLLAMLGLIVLVVLLRDIFLKQLAINALEDSAGAEVNIGDLDSSLFPFSVTLLDLQITDPRQPANNQLAAQEVAADVELGPLLSQKLIINDLTIKRAAFSSKRQAPGKVYRIPDDSPGALFGDLPSVDEVLERSPLKTTKAAQDLQTAYDQHEATLKQQYQALPSKDDLQAYKEQLEQLKQTDFKDPAAVANAKAQFDVLKEQLKKDKQAIQLFRQSVSVAKQDLSPKLKALQQAPGEDYALLSGLVAGDEAAIKNVTQLVFGEQAEMWTDYILAAYQVAAPMMQNGQESVQQPTEVDTSGIPDLLIRQAHISLDLNGEEIMSEWQNITHQHALINAPTTFLIDSAKNAFWDALKLNGEFSMTDQGVQAEQSWQLVNAALQSLQLADNKWMSALMESGLLNANGSLSVKDSNLDGSAVMDFANLLLQTEGKTDTGTRIADAVKQLSDLTITTDMAGPFNSPELSFSSSLDNQLAGLLLNSLSPETQAKLDDLNARINAQAAPLLGDGNANMQQLLDWEALATGDMSTVDGMLESQFKSLIDQEKDKLVDKLKGKLFGN